MARSRFSPFPYLMAGPYIALFAVFVAYPVGRSIERIQGPARILLETYRRNARVANYSTQSARDRLRYEEFRRNEAETLRGTPRIAPPRSRSSPASS